MNIGQFRTRVKFEKNEPTALGAGRKDNFVEVLTTWGELKKKSGDRSLEGMNIVLNSSHELTVRLQADIENLEMKKIRLIINNRKFTPVSYEMIDQKKFFYKFNLKESE